MTQPPDTSSEAGWHLDKKVPITLIVTILIHLGVSIWWARGLESRLSSVERDQARQEKRDEAQDNEARAAVAQLRSYLDRIDGKLDRLIERGNGK